MYYRLPFSDVKHNFQCSLLKIIYLLSVWCISTTPYIIAVGHIGVYEWVIQSHHGIFIQTTACFYKYSNAPGHLPRNVCYIFFPCYFMIYDNAKKFSFIDPVDFFIINLYFYHSIYFFLWNSMKWVFLTLRESLLVFNHNDIWESSMLFSRAMTLTSLPL